MPFYEIIVLGNVFGSFVCLFFNVLGQITKFGMLFYVPKKSFWNCYLSVNSRSLGTPARNNREW